MTKRLLIRPDKTLSGSYAEALREGLHNDVAKPEEIARIETDFDGWYADRHDLNVTVTCPDGQTVKRVPHSDFWLVDNDRVLGVVSLRHELNDFLMQFGGHIGFAVRRSERGKGYGHTLLRETLPHARTLGITRALVTCDDDNQGSIRIIESAGGVLENKIRHDFRETPSRRYWIAL